jgi:alpha-beta hydrolase superfamily lysophospholipase
LRKLLLPHGASQIEAQLALPKQGPRALVLICHGIGERLYFWSKVQLLLAEAGIGSLVFHYTSYGQSRGPCTPEAFESSAQAASAYLASLAPEAPLFLFGTSLGTAVAAQVAATLQPAPAGVILSQGFPSLREAGKSVLARLHLAALPVHGFLPDVWRSAENLAAISLPVLVIHSPDDELFSPMMGEQLYAGAASRRDGRQHLVVPAGFAHDDVSLRPAMEYWQPILDFIRAETDYFTKNAEAATRSPLNPSATAVAT